MRRHTVQFELPGEANGTLLRIDVTMIATTGNGNGRDHSRVAAPRGFLPQSAVKQADRSASERDSVAHEKPLAFTAPRGYLV
jgi:hypothetical protein